MQRRGFTLIELLTVVAIIAVLAAILFAVVTSVKRRAEHTACAENLHQLGLAVTMYANDHDGWVPPATTAESDYTGLDKPVATAAEVEASPEVLRKAMAPYVKNDAVWFCPSDIHARENVLWLGQRHRLTSYFFYPRTGGQPYQWPPAMQLARDKGTNGPPNSEDIPLFSDAVGVPARDSDPVLGGDIDAAQSNHPDTLVNAIRHDLSLSRREAKYWMGTDH